MKYCAACNGTFDDALSFCPRDGEVLQEPPGEMVGRVIDGKYRVESFIAQGGMGSVYLARHILLGDRVVIKTLRPEMRSNAEWLKRLRREGQAARAFRHPNSVIVYDLSTGADGLVYLVMEYVEGHTLDRELKARGRFTPAEALEVLAPVADVLDAAHARGVVHRDLKPENVMLGGGAVKVLDLGIAKLVGGDSQAAGATSLTTAGQILGTPYYMSPEQWGETPPDGGPEVDGRADVYSLGVISFELVTGRKPFDAPTLYELRRRHVSEPPPLLHEAAEGVPAAFGLAVARAMSKDRADRQPTAGALVGELRAALSPSEGPPGESAAGASLPAFAAARQTGAGRVPEALTASLPPRAEAQGGASIETAQAAHSSEAETPAEPSSTEGRPTEANAPARETRANADGRRAGGRRAFVPAAAGGALALLLAAGVFGWMKWGRGTPASREEVTPPAPAAVAAPSPAAEARPVEAASYWIEVFDSLEDESGERVADAAPTLVSGQRFRFHFTPRSRGYLYVVGPGEGNAQTTLLTAQGGGRLKSNLVVAGADFVYPTGGARLRLDEQPGAEDYTFIFSPAPLDAPKFLTEKFLRELTPAEVRELEEFRARHAKARAGAEPKPGNPANAVSVLIPQPAVDAAAPFVLDVRINHK